MYIKSMILEGFKSYGNRLEINGFDKEFNAITGFNGSGKSNILDAICFVLGITNLSQIRASTLQDLVYKSGQTGIKKASVTIIFDNSDSSASPMGYDHCKEIAVMRQILIGGKNKYMINGSNVPNNRVQDMFCSVQLNVNNPHFIIMQGRITKVLNMKPSEILSMVEEAAGTKMYETKRQAAIRTIEKKDGKLKEINDILKEVIGPKLNKLKEERSQYVEFQRIERELEHCRRIYIAWKYVTALQNRETAEGNVKAVRDQIVEKEKIISDGQQEIKSIELELVEKSNKMSAESREQLEVLERELKDVEKKEHKLTAESNSNKENIKAQEKIRDQLISDISDDTNSLALKEKELEKVGGLFQKLKEGSETDSEAVSIMQEKYQKISSGLLETDSGENATLEQQLMDAKQSAVQAQTEIKQCEMTLNHTKEQLTKRQKDMQSTDNEYKKDSKNLEDMEKELKYLEKELIKVNYKDGSLEELQERKQKLTMEIKVLQEKVDHFELMYPQLRFEYRDPTSNFNRNSVMGLICKLFQVKDKKAAFALEIAAGGKLYNVITDTEITSKMILQRGDLQQRVTLIPLNKINGRPMDSSTINFAQKLVGKENVQTALSLIDFPERYKTVMNWIFGQIFICKDMDTAKKLAFHDRISKKCVTIEGDTFDPAGTLSGGAIPKRNPILLEVEQLNAIQGELTQKKCDLDKIDYDMASILKIAEKATSLKRRFELKRHEIDMIKQVLQQTTHYKIKEEVDALKVTIEELKRKIETAKQQEKDSITRAKELEFQLKDSTNIRKKQLKECTEQIAALKKKSEESRKTWQQREQESEILNLEIKEMQKTIDDEKAQLVKAKEKLITLQEKDEIIQTDLDEIRVQVKTLQTNLKAQKDVISRENKSIQKLTIRKENIIKQKAEVELEIKKLNHEINAIKKNSTECKNKVSELSQKYEWIDQDKAYFGEAGGMYDFNVNNPEETKRKMQRLEADHQKLSRNVNTRAMNLLDKEEEQYNDLLKKKDIVENDKRKIFETIRLLDKKKKETLLEAWEQVNTDFGSIFGSLLPGGDAKLQPPENQTVLEGLEIKIGFSGVWKESLGELSGGQRSLVALSLIFAMLLFKPAPIYILDEVDAALDLAHTENIGTMLKQHFKHSQFIIVSLKEGMFNNANVLFTTQFVDGMSVISRIERSKSG